MYTPDADDVRIHEAASGGDLQLLKELAAKIGDAENFRMRCEMGKDYWGITGLHYAAKQGLIQICEFLIEKVKVDINIKTDHGDTPLLLAVQTKSISTAKYLINRGADVAIANSNGMSCLHYAAQKDNRELIEILLLKGADIESNSVNGTPLQCAAACEHADSVRFLLDNGAEPNPVSLLFASPLIYGIYSPTECMELLLKAGADPNMNSLGVSPLACAAMIGIPRVVRSLLSAGDNPNLACLKPIEQAVSMGHVDVAKILFPLTERIPGYPDWTIHGIARYLLSDEADMKIEENKDAYLRYVDREGKKAVQRKDYATAVKWFSEAIYVNPGDARMKSNRSICWAKLNKPVFALHDAEACVILKPDWPKAHYREGVAWMQLKSYVMACRAFRRANILDPENDEILVAFGGSVVYAMNDVGLLGDRWKT